jgi:hypothetical protein
MDADSASVPLSLLVESLAGQGRRDEHFVRRLSAWLHDRGDRIHLDAIDALGLVDVVVTFRMKREVTLVVTGRRADFPGEVTVHFREPDFPLVRITADRLPRDAPYEVCTLDYSIEGREVELAAPFAGLPAGTRGVALVDATMGSDRHLRARFGDCDPVNLPHGTYRVGRDRSPENR